MRVTRRHVLAAALLASTAVKASAASTETYYMLVFSQAVAGREAEYDAWYFQRHLPDVLAVPGFQRGRRLQLAPVQFGKARDMPQNLAFFEIVTNDLPAVCAEVNRRLRSGETTMSSAMDMATAQGRMYRALHPATTSTGLPLDTAADAADGFHLVFNTPTPGKEAEFNDWYDHEHLPDMLTIPGFVSGQRAAVSDVKPMPGPAGPPYMALFRFVPDDLPALAQRFTEAMPHLRLKPVMSGAAGYTYLPKGPVLNGDDVRRSRAK